MSKIYKSVSGKSCYRCESIADDHREIWHLIDERQGFCIPCMFDLMKMMLTVEKIDKGEID